MLLLSVMLPQANKEYLAVKTETGGNEAYLTQQTTYNLKLVLPYCSKHLTLMYYAFSHFTVAAAVAVFMLGCVLARMQAIECMQLHSLQLSRVPDSAIVCPGNS